MDSYLLKNYNTNLTPAKVFIRVLSVFEITLVLQFLINNFSPGNSSTISRYLSVFTNILVWPFEALVQVITGIGPESGSEVLMLAVASYALLILLIIALLKFEDRQQRTGSIHFVNI